MSRKDPQLEKFIRSKLDEKEFAYQDAYWVKAQGSMVQWERKRKRRRFAIWFFTIGSLLLGVYIGLWQGQHHMPIPSETNTSLNSKDRTIHSSVAHPEIPATTDELLPNTQSRIQSNSDEKFLNTEAFARSEAITFSASHSGSSLSEKPSETQHITPSFTNSAVGHPLERNQMGQSSDFSKHAASHSASSIIHPIIPEHSSKLLPGEGTFSAENPEFPYQKAKRWGLQVQGGLNLYQDFVQEAIAQKNLASPLLGICFTLPVGKQFQLGTGLQYFSRKGIHRSRQTIERQYDFIARETQYTANTESLHFMAIPMQFSYQIAPRHRIFTGLNFAYLLNARSTLNIDQRNSLEEKNNSSEAAWGYTQGFRAFSIATELGYAFRLSTDWEIGLNAYIGLTDLTKPGEFVYDNKDFNRHLSIYLLYNLK